MCPIQYQSLLVLLDPPDGIFQSKVEKSSDKASPCFRPFSMVNLSDRFLETQSQIVSRQESWQKAAMTYLKIQSATLTSAWRG
jgi:hypothetical protein